MSNAKHALYQMSYIPESGNMSKMPGIGHLDSQHGARNLRFLFMQFEAMKECNLTQPLARQHLAPV
jgi:hypothetical protein